MHPLGRGVQDRAGELALHDVGEVAARVELQHLADLLAQRHPRQQVVKPLLDREGGIAVGQGVGGVVRHVPTLVDVARLTGDLG
ncbi:hypothetical protein GCM10009740_19930 [Terrabacter terrae]|uniref:Uncharacterized protein n=1 Tax=Terrabacter terrae TaxID=318434 RepID=A0ABN2U8P0_9MICO